MATMNPGLSYVTVSWQLAAEAIVPLNSEAGRAISEAAHQWIAVHQEPWTLVVGGALIHRPFVDDVLAHIAGDKLAAARVLPTMRVF